MFVRRTEDRELAEELEAHLEMLQDEYVRRGIAPAEARRRARLTFGSLSSTTESVRDLRGVPVPTPLRAMGFVLRDAYGALRRAPWHSATVAGVLAVGITAGTVTFSVVDAVLLRPLPIRDGDRIVTIGSFDAQARKGRINGEVFWQLHDHSSTLDAVASFMTMHGQSSTIGDVTDEFPIAHTSRDAFNILDVSAGLGRLWTPEEEARGETDVAVLGYRFWQRDLGGRPDVLGMTVRTGDRSFRVIGVLSAASDHPEIRALSTPIWLPGVVRRDQTGGMGILARMRSDRTRSMVADELRSLTGAPEWTPVVTGLLDEERDRLSRWMWLALGASGLLVLLGCANAANLMLSRSIRRARELALRASLGASGRRVAGGIVAEGLLLSLAATAFALLLSVWGVDLARHVFSTLPLGISQAPGIALNGRVMAAAVVSAILTGVFFSLVPALQASRVPVVTSLKDGAPSTSGGRGRWRRAFLVTEVATVTVLLVVSWLFVASLVRVVGVDLGVDRSRLISVAPRMPYRGGVDEVLARLHRVPGVADVAESTGAMISLFGSGVWVTTNVSSLDAPVEPPFDVLQYRVTPNYFDVAGIAFLRGSTWMDGSPNPVVLDDVVARRLFGEGDPIGRQVRATRPDGVHKVVGVVPSIRAKGLEQDLQMAAYFPPDQRRRGFSTLLVRTTGPTDAIAAHIAETLEPVGPGHKNYIHTGDEVIRRATMMRRFNAGLMSVFGLVGVLIGAAGIYAVTSSVVTQQTNEIGVRMALGASPRQIAQQVLTSVLTLTGAGLAVGVPVAWWVSRGFGSLLFGITPADISVYAGVSGIVCAVGVIAALLPSRRAARVDPIVSLRA